MSTYTAPGVYVEEISTLPPSVAEVATAVPAFIGYTNDLKNSLRVVQVRTLREYEAELGKAASTVFSVTVQNTATDSTQPPVYKIAQIAVDDRPVDLGLASEPKEPMWYALDLYFRNGGGRCYVVSLGKLDGGGRKTVDFGSGLDELKKYDEPTLIVIPEILDLPETDRATVLAAALTHCWAMGNRFAILDAYPDKEQNVDYGAFKTAVGQGNLSYGSAYYPRLDTALTHYYEDASVTVGVSAAVDSNGNPTDAAKLSAANALAQQIKDWLLSQYTSGADASVTAVYKDVLADETNIGSDTTLAGAIETALAGVTTFPVAATTIIAGLTAAGGALQTLVASLANCQKAGSSDARIAIDLSAIASADAFKDKNIAFSSTQTLSQLATTNTGLYNFIKQALAAQWIRLPPSPALAGVYARVDRERGVWKAPANVGLMSVIGPSEQITSDDQATLNIDSDSGKSINAIRSFPGKGVLVWGARTLDGNSNEWRYIPVRRLFLMIEESVKRASAFAVFEPNDSTTWLKVRGMIESYLYGLWQQGALQGADPKAAYYVSVGLGQTMTPQEILDGLMIVEVGIAAVRPAEFIVLRFSHKLATA
jgi:uncharacterized protein